MGFARAPQDARGHIGSQATQKTAKDFLPPWKRSLADACVRVTLPVTPPAACPLGAQSDCDTPGKAPSPERRRPSCPSQLLVPTPSLPCYNRFHVAFEEGGRCHTLHESAGTSAVLCASWRDVRGHLWTETSLNYFHPRSTDGRLMQAFRRSSTSPSEDEQDAERANGRTQMPRE